LGEKRGDHLTYCRKLIYGGSRKKKGENGFFSRKGEKQKKEGTLNGPTGKKGGFLAAVRTQRGAHRCMRGDFPPKRPLPYKKERTRKKRR